MFSRAFITYIFHFIYRKIPPNLLRPTIWKYFSSLLPFDTLPTARKKIEDEKKLQKYFFLMQFNVKENANFSSFNTCIKLNLKSSFCKFSLVNICPLVCVTKCLRSCPCSCYNVTSPRPNTIYKCPCSIVIITVLGRTLSYE